MRLSYLIPIALLWAGAQGSEKRDLYPEARALIREAEAIPLKSHRLDDGSDLASWAGRLYARAGYLEDAARAFGTSQHGNYGLLHAHVLYGDLAGAEREIEATVDPESKAKLLMSLGHLLWRMGESDPARSRYEAARRMTPQIANPEHRKQVLASIEQDLRYVSNEPPIRLTAVPQPATRVEVADSPFPAFPVTTDGFRDRDSKAVGERVAADAAFLKKLYDRMEAGDRDGVLAIIESGVTPFQKTLGLASVMHLLIQVDQPEPAEHYAEQMPEADSDCRLAKAEAFTAAGAAWLRAGNAARAHTDFEGTNRLVKSVPDIPLGKVSVLLALAKAQAKGGMVASAGISFRTAKELAEELPLLPAAPAKSQSKAAGPRLRYRDDAYRSMLPAAIQAHDLGAAHEAARLWMLADSRAATSIVEAWWNAGRPDEAAAFARQLGDPAGRVTALLVLAGKQLDRAGAPIL